MSDLISRQAAIEAIKRAIWDKYTAKDAIDAVCNVPSAQPEIVRCRECKFASGNSRICMKFGYGPIGELDFCAWGERKDNDE